MVSWNLERRIRLIQLDQYENRAYKRGASRMGELAWVLMRAIFFMHSIPVSSGLKTAILRMFGAKIGRGVVIRSRVNISMPWFLEIGDHVWIGDDVGILSLAPVKIGSHTCISQRAYLCTGSHDFSSKSFALIVKPITIHDGCWIGAVSFVGPGVTMQECSRSCAGAVVVKDVPSGTTVAGVPAKPLVASKH